LAFGTSRKKTSAQHGPVSLPTVFQQKAKESEHRPLIHCLGRNQNVDWVMILYTGSTGTIGSEMPSEHTALYSRLESTEAEMSEEIARVSQGKPFSMIHLAALVSVTECEAQPEKAFILNVEGASKWLQAAQKNGCERFVFVSTSHVFLASPDRKPLTETSPVGPRSVYAKSKLAAEEKLKVISEGSKTTLVIARVFSILPRVLRPGYLLTSLHERAKNRDLSPIPGLSNIRDFLPTDEICRQLVALTNEPLPAGRVVLICSGQGQQILDVAKAVFKQYGLGGHKLQEAPGRPDDIAYIVGQPYEFENK
jgi:nucleoside-diphosphate-sugar epimerase